MGRALQETGLWYPKSSQERSLNTEPGVTLSINMCGPKIKESKQTNPKNVRKAEAKVLRGIKIANIQDMNIVESSK